MGKWTLGSTPRLKSWIWNLFPPIFFSTPWKMNGWNPENHLGFQIFILGCTKSPSFSGVYHQKKTVLFFVCWSHAWNASEFGFLGLNHPRNPGSQLLPFVTFWQTPNWRSRKFTPEVWSRIKSTNLKRSLHWKNLEDITYINPPGSPPPCPTFSLRKRFGFFWSEATHFFADVLSKGCKGLSPFIGRNFQG